MKNSVEKSRNQEIEPNSRRDRLRALAVHTIIEALQEQRRNSIIDTPTRNIVEDAYIPVIPFQHDVEDNKEGFDITGNYHRISHNRWDDMGNPFVVDI